jgi:hypothetical protein
MNLRIDIKKITEEWGIDKDEVGTASLVIREVWGKDRIGVGGTDALSNPDVQELPNELAEYIDPHDVENGTIGSVAFTRDEILEIELKEEFDNVPTEELTSYG